MKVLKTSQKQLLIVYDPPLSV